MGDAVGLIPHQREVKPEQTHHSSLILLWISSPHAPAKQLMSSETSPEEFGLIYAEAPLGQIHEFTVTAGEPLPESLRTT